MRFLILVSSLLVSTGCAYRTPSINIAQPVHVTHVAVSGPGATPEIADRARVMLDKANKHACGAPMDMSIAVNVDKPRDYLSFLHTDGMGIFFVIWPVLGGMVIEREKLAVDVVITSGNRLLRGHGTADKEGSIYAPAQKRALAVALDRALLSAR